MADRRGPPSLDEAWALCYLDPVGSGAIGAQLAEARGADAAWGWWHVALAHARLGRTDASVAALAQARAAFGAAPETRTEVLCDEVEAIACRGAGDLHGAQRLHEAADARGDPGLNPLDRFIAHNSRAITSKIQGRVDDTLRHFLMAYDAAEASANLGAQITATSNLGGYQHDLYNLDDACAMSEKALLAARQARSLRNVATAANNLVMTYHALGQPQRASEAACELAGLLRDHADALPTGSHERYRAAIALGHLAVGQTDEAERLLSAGHVDDLGDNDGFVMWTWIAMRCALARGEAARARQMGEAALSRRQAQGLPDMPYDLMQLHHALADACETLGDAQGALAGLRRTHGLYVELVGRSARARRIALEVSFELARTRRERDAAIENHHRAEADRRRLSELNAALQAQVRENEALQLQLREQALHDPLTGLHNRRYLFETAPGMLELARRQGSQLCVVLLDLDHFKQLNDNHGHQAGDLVLQAFAARARSALRRSDLLCRHGGEEFVAVMPDIDAEGAYTVLGRLLDHCLQGPLVDAARPLPISTFSAGIALFPQHGDTLEQLLQRADLALYAAKGQGRARVEIAASSGHGALN